MNIYFYPITTKLNRTTQNPYAANFIKALKGFFTIINYHDASSVGILKTLKYLFRIDVLLANWIENLPDKHGGYFQSMYFFLLVFFLKIRNKKLVWIMHNKLSHNPKNFFIKKVLFKFLLKNADLIITHAKEGIAFARSLSGNDNLNIHHFPHPTIPTIIKPDHEKGIDILIWGALAPYKGIEKFLQFIYEKQLEQSYKIRIVGKITSLKYQEVLTKFQNKHIKIENKFIEKENLEALIRKSKVVLFTYSSDSVLSSGALIDSLSMRAVIIGPNKGNFRDLNQQGLIHVYNDFHELISILDHLLHTKSTLSQSAMDTYFEETSWNRFIIEFDQWVRELS